MPLELSNNGFRNTDMPRWATWSPDLVQLFERDRGKLLRVAQRITGNRDEAEDVVQDSALKALVNLPRFRRESQFGTWFCSIIVNAAIDRLRTKSRRRIESLDSPAANNDRFLYCQDRASSSGPEEWYTRRELHWLLFSEMAQLKPAYRAVIRLCYIEGHSYTEAAEILNVDVGTVKSRLYRGRKKLRHKLCERAATYQAFPAFRLCLFANGRSVDVS